MIYLDHAATTPISDNAKSTWITASDRYFANSSSLHEAGEQAIQLLYTCKQQLASLLHCDSDELFFTSGGTESNLLALESLYLAHKHRGKHMITSSLEHPSVHAFFHKAEAEGIEVTYLPVDEQGKIALEDIKNATRDDTFLASIQHVNSEIGIIQPIKELSYWFKQKNILFHSDCVQSFGKIPMDLSLINADAISISSHKLYGPKGVGLVYLSKQTKWKPVYPLTSHQQGFRPGTLNIPGIAGFTRAALDIHDNLEGTLAAAWEMRDEFINQLHPLHDRLHIEGSPKRSEQLPWILGIAIHGVQGQYMLLSLDRYHICISTGSACQSEKLDASSAMNAIYEDEQERQRFFRISFGKDTTREQLAFVANKILQIANQ